MRDPATPPTPPALRLPHTLVIVMALVVLVLALSWLLPSGEFQRIEKAGRQVTVPGTFKSLPKAYLGPEMLLIAPVRGFVDGALIIAFLFVIGGAFNVVQETGTITFAIRRVTRAIAARPHLEKLLIPLLMVFFSLAGSVFGMSEETIPFVLIFIPLSLALGYDSIVGISIPFLGAAAGFAAAFFNPFTVGIAQGLTELPLYSGLEYRLICWVIGTAVVIAYVMVYAAKVKRNPQLSPVYAIDRSRESAGSGETVDDTWTVRHILVIFLFALTMVLLVWGILEKQWYIEEIAALFLAMGLMLGAVAGLRPSRIARGFVTGAKDMVNVAFIIACGRALLIIAKDGQVLDTMLNAGVGLISALPLVVAAQMMFLVQSAINFFIHSGTAQAALTMPIMAPLADLLGLTRQTVVFAFQLCEFVNPILPTSAVTMGVLGVARVPWEKWARWFLPLMLILMALSLALLVPPVLLRWGPF
ncbi:MAG: putative basic amino acid antiporter YfcC [Acidobacteria bacterium]|nr:putative basic amino acid antiporter YfcC [Acidobacteriota bacterium]